LRDKKNHVETIAMSSWDYFDHSGTKSVLTNTRRRIKSSNRIVPKLSIDGRLLTDIDNDISFITVGAKTVFVVAVLISITIVSVIVIKNANNIASVHSG